MKADAGAGVHAEVAEHHRLDVDGGAEVLGDPLLAAVEHARGRCSTSRRRRGWRGPAARAGPAGSRGRRARVTMLLEGRRRAPRRSSASRSRSFVGALGVLGRVEGVGEVLAVDAEHGGAEHLQQPAVGVQREALVLALPGEARDRLVVEADVEDGLHHPGHRELRARAHADTSSGSSGSPSVGPSPPRAREVLADLARARRARRPSREVGAARLGGDREARRHRQPQVGHLGEVGALAPEQVLLVLVAVGEVVDPGASPLHLAPWRGVGHPASATGLRVRLTCRPTAARMRRAVKSAASSATSSSVQNRTSRISRACLTTPLEDRRVRGCRRRRRGTGRRPSRPTGAASR